ncbi:MAG: hypothetical protein HYW13_01200 [Planctomycetes bacterium]|nr:hypothetical protein [Planctomycetota bacterium]
MPLISAVAPPVANVMLTLEPSVSEEPLGITKSSPDPFPTVRVTAAALCKVILVLFDRTIRPTVWVGTDVIVRVVPVLNCNTSFVAGVVLVGVQLVSVAHEAASAPCQV